ncbi:hypothetical protein GLYMA_20G207300v4 [Glycine max]|nr:hypothetical protein GLYMA_20G207300v4 [Glycine max]KAH1037150.1 hypothetical protein GYH30_056529 [Glycine max]
MLILTCIAMEDEEDEKEIQIGFPTDVKHLAHIGAENAKASQPSWLAEFKESSEASSGTVVNPTKATTEDNNSDANSKGEGKRSHNRKSRPRSTESQSSTSRDISNAEGSKPSRRHHSESSRRMNRHLSEEEKEKAPTTTKHSQRNRKSKMTSSEEKDEKEGSSRRAPRSQRHSKGDSLTDFSFSDSGPGPT